MAMEFDSKKKKGSGVESSAGSNVDLNTSSLGSAQSVGPRIEYGVDIFTGIRPTGGLTVANYLGAVRPILDLQRSGIKPLVFVADLHAITDQEPAVAQRYKREVVADYLGLGLDPSNASIFLQSQLAPQVYELMVYLMRHISVAELVRCPTLKDKLTTDARPETANALLASYPVMMSADILLQRARRVPVGEDQLAHLEISRKLVRRFNRHYGPVFGEPEPLEVKSLRIRSLKGEGKMTKTKPEGAILLTDTPEAASKKIRQAQTAIAGQMNDSLESHLVLAKGLCSTQQDEEIFDQIIARHLGGANVMGEFKKEFSRVAGQFLVSFQDNRAAAVAAPGFIDSILDEGATRARTNADRTLKMVNEAFARKGQGAFSGATDESA